MYRNIYLRHNLEALVLSAKTLKSVCYREIIAGRGLQALGGIILSPRKLGKKLS